MTAAVFIIFAFFRFAVHVYSRTRMTGGIGCAVFSLLKTFTAGIARMGCISATDGNISFAAVVVFAVHTAGYGTV